MLGESRSTNPIMLMHLTADGKMEHSYILPERKKVEESFQDEEMINQAYQKGLLIEITISKQKNNQPTKVKGRIFHIDRRNKKLILIDNANEKAKRCTPISFVDIIDAKVIHTNY